MVQARDGLSSKESNFVSSFIAEYMVDVSKWGIDQSGIEKLIDNFLHRITENEKQIQTQMQTIQRLIEELTLGQTKISLTPQTVKEKKAVVKKNNVFQRKNLFECPLPLF